MAGRMQNALAGFLLTRCLSEPSSKTAFVANSLISLVSRLGLEPRTP